MRPEIFDPMFRHQKYGAAQNYYELQAAVNILDETYPIFICEIGTFKGGTLRHWHKMLALDGLLISIDLNDRGFIPEIQEEYKDDDRVSFIIGDSMSDDTEEAFKKTIQGHELDILFIDACHQYAYIKNDIERYKKYVREGGYIVIHDIVGNEVGRAWRELVESTKYTMKTEIFGGVNPCGIGILRT